MTKKIKSRLRQWWQTDCEYCKRTRLLLIWCIVLLPWIAWWVISLGEPTP
ncbi:hypothetical protein [Aliidiomarina soli]|nr:hypothetical protein [Aliidiomarina soli]